MEQCDRGIWSQKSADRMAFLPEIYAVEKKPPIPNLVACRDRNARVDSGTGLNAGGRLQAPNGAHSLCLRQLVGELISAPLG
jgi:hypothetical protein